MTRATAALIAVLVVAVCATAIAVAVIVTQDRNTPAETAPAPTTLPPDDPATDGCETLLATASRVEERNDASDDASAAGATKRDLYDMSVRHHAMTLLDLDTVISECGPDVGNAARAVRQLTLDTFADTRAACREGGLDHC